MTFTHAHAQTSQHPCSQMQTCTQALHRGFSPKKPWIPVNVKGLLPARVLSVASLTKISQQIGDLSLIWPGLWWMDPVLVAYTSSPWQVSPHQCTLFIYLHQLHYLIITTYAYVESFQLYQYKDGFTPIVRHSLLLHSCLCRDSKG